MASDVSTCQLQHHRRASCFSASLARAFLPIAFPEASTRYIPSCRSQTRGKGRMLGGDAGAGRWNVEAITSEIVGRAYTAGDPLAKEILLETVELLAIWLGNIVDLLEPDVIILGGGVATMLSPFFREIRDRLPAWCVNARCREIPLVPARYGENAGIAGGAALCPRPCQPNWGYCQLHSLKEEN